MSAPVPEVLRALVEVTQRVAALKAEQTRALSHDADLIALGIRSQEIYPSRAASIANLVRINAELKAAKCEAAEIREGGGLGRLAQMGESALLALAGPETRARAALAAVAATSPASDEAPPRPPEPLRIRAQVGACGKRVFGSKDAAKRGNKTARFRIRPYLCATCRGWHVANEDKQGGRW